MAAAYDHYLRGRHQWNRFTGDGYRAAIRELESAVELDPEYAEAWAGLADAYNLYAFEGDGSPSEWFDRGRSAAETAIAIDSRLASGYNALAFSTLYGSYDAARAASLFDRALELQPSFAMAHHFYAGALAALERHDESIAAVRRGLELDPLSLSVRSDLGWYYLFADRWQEGVDECLRTLDMSPGYGWAVGCLVQGLLRLDRYPEAVRYTLERLQDQGLVPRPAPEIEALRDAEAMRELLRIQLDRETSGDVDPLARGLLLSLLGDVDAAVDWLETAYTEREPWLVFLRVDPRFDPLHGHPRFEALVTRMHASSGSAER